MNVLQTFFYLGLLQAKPQDVPFSYQLLGITAITSVACYILALQPASPELNRILGEQDSITMIAIAEHGFFAAAVWAILKLRGHGARFVQAITAIFGVSTIIRFLMWVISSILGVDHEAKGITLAGMSVVGLSLWILVVYAHIFKETLETRFGVGVLFTIASQMLTSMLLLMVFKVNL